MITLFKSVCTIAALFCIAVLFELAYTYTFTTGYGLNPWIAIPLVFCLMGYIAFVLCFCPYHRDTTDEVKDITNHLFTK